ncbi:hypothetical protein KY340_01855 [Candidatus Woesearchaeota archaeon]|nr:hypothetical protein [Candidatus Woesearchaeota archaeon]
MTRATEELREKHENYKIFLNSGGLDIKVDHDSDPKKVILLFPMLGEVVLGACEGLLSGFLGSFHAERGVARWGFSSMQDSIIQEWESREDESLKPSVVADLFMAHPECQAYVFGRRRGIDELYKCEDPRHPITGQKLDDHQLAIPQISGALFHGLDDMQMKYLCQDLMMAMFKPIPVIDSDKTLSFVDLTAVIFGAATQHGQLYHLLDARVTIPKYKQETIDNALKAKPTEHPLYELYESALFARISHYMGEPFDLDPNMMFWPLPHVFKQKLEIIERLKKEAKGEESRE